MSIIIQRNPRTAAHQPFDVVVVGGGVQGLCLTLEAVRRGLRVAMLDSGDFGGGVSGNSLRIIHGGLRYLQHLDLSRFQDSVVERRWFMRHFSTSVAPLTCLMPLYGDGLRRPAVFRAAGMINDALSLRRNTGVAVSHHLPRTAIVDASRTVSLFPSVDQTGLQGAAVWHDGQIVNSQRLIMELCRWAVSNGAVLLNYVEATGLQQTAGRVTGIEAIDRVSGGDLVFRTPKVINAAGPWCPEVSQRFGDARPEAFRPAVAFNVLFDRPPVATTAVAVAAREPDARTYFLHNEGPYLLGGTYHAAGNSNTLRDECLYPWVADYCESVNRAIPGLDLRPEQALRVYAGLLPTANQGDVEPTDRPVIIDHHADGGTDGLWTVAAVKYTTARQVANKALSKILPTATRRPIRPCPDPVRGLATVGDETLASVDDAALIDAARQLIEDESVIHLEDLLLRRTAWSRDPCKGTELARTLGRKLGYDDTAINAACLAIGTRPFPNASADGPETGECVAFSTKP